jgi:hypothetical protein
MADEKNNLTERVKRAVELCAARENHIPHSPYCHLLYGNANGTKICPHQGLSTNTVNYRKGEVIYNQGYLCNKDVIDEGGGLLF